MEYLRVIFPDQRNVVVDGVELGQTNDVLELEGGHHEVTLNGEKNFSPVTKNILLRDTIELSPFIVNFAKISIAQEEREEENENE